MANFKIEEFYKDTMKTYLNYSQNNQINNNALLMQKRKHVAEQAKKNTIARENNELNRPARAISFGGSASLNKVIRSGKKAFNAVVEYTSAHEASTKAFTALVVAGIIKPAAVLSMPGSEDKDKQIVATKNFLNAFLGFILSKTITGTIIDRAYEIIERDLKFIKGVSEDNKIQLIDPDSQEALELAKKALSGNKPLFGKKSNQTPTIDDITKKSKDLIEDFRSNRLKHFENNIGFLKDLKDKNAKVKPGKVKQALIDKTKNLSENNFFKVHASDKTIKEGYEVFWKNCPDWFVAIGKAKISSILLPGVMAFLFAKKNLEKQQKEIAKKNILTNNSTFKKEQAEFQRMLNKNSSQPSFTGGFNSAISSIASGIERIGNGKTGEKIARWTAGFNNPFGRMADIESIGITLYWLQDTARSKKIEPSQKLGLNVHTALVTIVSSTAAFIIDKVFDSAIKSSENKYTNNIKAVIEQIKQTGKDRGIDLKQFTSINDGIPSIATKAKELAKNGIQINIDPIKMAIKDTCYSAVDGNKTAQEALNLLLNTDLIKNLPSELKNEISLGNIESYMTLIKNTNPIKDAIKEASQDLTFSNNIAKELSRTNLLDEGQVTNAVKELTKKYGKALSKFKTLTIFTLVVRFLVPVLMVPFSGKLKKKIVERAEKRQQAKATA